MKLLYLRFGFSRRRRVDVLFIRSGQITRLEPHFAPHSYVELEYGSRRVLLHPVFVAFLAMNLIRLTSQRAFLKTYVQFFRTTSVICYDNIPGIWDCADVLEKPMICVQHGMRQMLEKSSEEVQLANVIFLSWGKLQEEDYQVGRTPCAPNSSFNRKPLRTMPIGSLRDSMYRATKYRSEVSENQICVVSQFKEMGGTGLTLPDQRQLNIDLMLANTKRYAMERNCVIAIALYAKSEPYLSIERNWYRERFGDLCVFNDPLVDFATYRLVDESSISLGIHTSVLWEALGRKQKILACNFTGESVFQFPIPGIWYLTNGDYSEFERRLDTIRSMSVSAFEELLAEWPSFIISFDPQNPTHSAISRVIEAQKSNPLLR